MTVSNEVIGLRIEPTRDGVRVLRLDRPEKRNAIATPLLTEIVAALADASGEDDVRCLIITGSDKLFAAGADINELASKDVAGALDDPRPSLWNAIRRFPKPLIAAVEGWCLGAGNELLMCCDFAIAGESAKFGQPETNLGIIPGAGGTATLPRIVGRGAAMRMVLLGEPIDAHEAFRLGLVSEVVPTGEAVVQATMLARKIAARAPVAMRQAKAMVGAVYDLGHASHLLAERQAFSALFGTADRHEGVASFFEKRPPIWAGR